MKYTVATAVLLSVLSVPLRAPGAQTLPAATTAGSPTTAGAPERLSATITAVQRLVQVREAPDKPWQPARVGMVLGEEAEFRTGPRSSVQFTIPPGQTIALDRLGTVKLLTAVVENGKVTTDLGMKYGRTRFDVETGGVEHAASITSPSSTLAVRGTKVSLYDQRPFRAEAVSLTGAADFKAERRTTRIGGKNSGKAKVDVQSPDAAAFSLSQSFVDPSIALARSDAEARLVANLLSQGANVFVDRDSGIKVVTGGTPPNDGQLIPNLPGVLNFVVRWGTNSNIDMGVSSPGGVNNGGEFLFPAKGLDTNTSGGRTAFDHRGGPNGGIEIAYFPADHPKGLYGVGLVLTSGQPTVATVDAFLGGKRIDIYDGLSLRPSVSVPVFPLTPGLGEGTLAGVVPVGTTIPGVSATPAARRNGGGAAREVAPTPRPAPSNLGRTGSRNR